MCVPPAPSPSTGNALASCVTSAVVIRWGPVRWLNADTVRASAGAPRRGYVRNSGDRRMVYKCAHCGGPGGFQGHALGNPMTFSCKKGRENLERKAKGLPPKWREGEILGFDELEAERDRLELVAKAASRYTDCVAEFADQGASACASACTEHYSALEDAVVDWEKKQNTKVTCMKCDQVIEGMRVTTDLGDYHDGVCPPKETSIAFTYQEGGRLKHRMTDGTVRDSKDSSMVRCPKCGADSNAAHPCTDTSKDSRPLPAVTYRCPECGGVSASGEGKEKSCTCR